MWSTIPIYYKITGLYYGEVSNIFNYLVYHRLQLKIPCNFLKIIQSLWFSYFRTYKAGQLLLQYWSGNIHSWALGVLYMIGNYWVFNQIKKLYIINVSRIIKSLCG